MIRTYVDELLSRLERMQQWPPKREEKLLKDLYLWNAFREGDAERLKGEHGGWRDDRKYYVDPLAGRIAEAKSDLTFGEEPEFTAQTDADQTLLEDLIDENAVPDELQSACELGVSEGESWWRVVVDKDALDWPILEWHSRTIVYPYYRGRNLLATAFITVIEEENQAWRYVEAHGEGIVVNRLYEVPMARATSTRTADAIPRTSQIGKPFGELVDLSKRPETDGLPEEWIHDVGVMLAGRVINKRGRNPRCGVSDFKRVKDLMLSLNEATTVGHENMRLTAKKRIVTTSAALKASLEGQQPPEFDSSEEAFLQEQLDEELGRDTKDPFKVLEYSFDATSLIAWISHMEDKILVRTRTAPQLVGKNTEGAQTGPALRARLLDSILDSNQRGAKWDKATPPALRALQLVDALGSEAGGFGRPWQAATELPTMERKSTLPEDEDAQVLRLTTEVGSGILSRRTALEERHPDWDEDMVDEELRRIAEDEGSAEAPPPPADDEEEV